MVTRVLYTNSALVATVELFDRFHKGAVVCVSAFWCPALAVEGP